MFRLGFVPSEEAGWTGIEVKLYSLLEMERGSEDKKDDLPGRGNSMSKGVAGEQRESRASGIHEACASLKEGAREKSRGFCVRLFPWKWLRVMKLLKCFKQGRVNSLKC